MATTATDESLAVVAREWPVDRVATLLTRRPDLVEGGVPADVDELVDRAEGPRAIVQAIAGLSLPEHRLLQTLVCLDGPAGVDALLAHLPPGTTAAAVEPVLASLEEAALVWRHGGRLHWPAQLEAMMPVPVGPPVLALTEYQTVDYLRHALALVRDEVLLAGGSDLPPPPAGRGGRPPRKADLQEALRALLATPGVVDTLVGRAPAAAAEMARTQGRPGGPLVIHQALWHAPHRRLPAERTPPGWWLYERSLLLPLPGGADEAVQPRAVTVALRGGRVVHDLALERPPLVAGRTGAAGADATGAARAQRTVELVADLLERWRAAPARALKSGGLGATVLKALAGALDVDQAEAARLIELAGLAGLLTEEVSSRRERRKVHHETRVTASGAAGAWEARPVARRWRQLAGAWLRAGVWPSATGRRDEDTGKMVPLLAPRSGGRAGELRGLALAALAAMDDGGDGDPGPGGGGDAPTTTPGQLAARLYWRRPGPWLASPVQPPETAVAWIWAEAELLGILSDGRLTAAGRALLDGDADAAERAFAAAAPPAATTFTLQADLTAVVIGLLDRDVLAELRLMADVESQGGATTYRFTEASVRRALDAGRRGEDLLAFLEAHGSRGVPGPLAYLVGDAARRHGHLRVGTARAYVVADDVAVMADACSHRRTRKLGLQLLAPTVAVSAAEPALVLDALREAGFSPTPVDGDTAGVTLTPPRAGARPARAAAAGSDELPEPFRVPRGRRWGDPAPPVTPDEAARLAARIRAGRGGPGAAADRHRPGRAPHAPAGDGDGSGWPLLDLLVGLDLADHGTWERDGDAGDLDGLLDGAVAGTHVLVLAVEGRGPEPLMLIAGERPAGRVVGVDVATAELAEIDEDGIAAVVDLGPAAELDLDLAPPRRAGRRARR